MAMEQEEIIKLSDKDIDLLKYVAIARAIPGDVVVLKCNRRLTQEDKAFTCRQMMKLFPNNEVLVLDEECEIEIKRTLNSEDKL